MGEINNKENLTANNRAQSNKKNNRSSSKKNNKSSKKRKFSIKAIIRHISYQQSQIIS